MEHRIKARTNLFGKRVNVPRLILLRRNFKVLELDVEPAIDRGRHFDWYCGIEIYVLCVDRQIKII